MSMRVKERSLGEYIWEQRKDIYVSMRAKERSLCEYESKGMIFMRVWE